MSVVTSSSSRSRSCSHWSPSSPSRCAETLQPGVAARAAPPGVPVRVRPSDRRCSSGPGQRRLLLRRCARSSPPRRSLVSLCFLIFFAVEDKEERARSTTSWCETLLLGLNWIAPFIKRVCGTVVVIDGKLPPSVRNLFCTLLLPALGSVDRARVFRCCRRGAGGGRVTAGAGARSSWKAPARSFSVRKDPRADTKELLIGRERAAASAGARAARRDVPRRPRRDGRHGRREWRG